MAFPFGGHPTLASYIDWARSKGCSARSGIVSDDEGRVHSLTQIRAPNNLWVTVIGTPQDEHLAPTMVGYLDRRLGLKSPFTSIDAPDIDPEE